MIVLDTSVLISAFRRRGDQELPPEVVELKRLIQVDAPIAVPGVVLQELLAGARTDAQFERLARLAAPFPLLLADRALHHEAAHLAARCRWKGLTTTTTDCLIAAHTFTRQGSLFTLDHDFGRLAAVCPLELHGLS
jgi:predicted nucleic acid-binding protein